MGDKGIPKFYRDLVERYPDFMDAVQNLGATARKQGPLDHKTSQLIQLAAAVAIRSEGSVHSHTRRAIEAGATADEVRHALVLLTSTLGFPTVSAALSWVADELDD